MFFILASIQLYPLRHRSNMMRLLFCSMIFLAFLEFKDMGFLIKGVWYNPYITSITMSTDMLYVPLMALFFFEVISPGWVTLRRIIGIIYSRIHHIPVFCYFQGGNVICPCFRNNNYCYCFHGKFPSWQLYKKQFLGYRELEYFMGTQGYNSIIYMSCTLDHSPLGRKLVERCRLLCNIYYRLDLYLSVIPKTFGYRNAEYVQIIYAETWTERVSWDTEFSL